MRRLSAYAKENQITYRTAWNHFKQGKLEGAIKDETGHIWLMEANFNKPPEPLVAIYTRVSNNENKDNLDGQAKRLEAYALAKGYQIIHTIKEVGSGINDGRQKLLKLFDKDDWNILLVEHKDRLARLGVGYIEAFLRKENRRLEIANRANDDTSDLVQDLVAVIYSFSARLYGLRRTRRNTEKIVSYLQEIKAKPNPNLTKQSEELKLKD